MKVPFGTMTITPRARRLVREVVDSGRISSGRYVRELEQAFARFIGTRHAVALSSGTDADALALAVLYDLGAERGDGVIVPALSFVATGNAILQAGFTPQFVDVERETLNIDPSKIERAITRRTRAIMPVHLMGKPAAMDIIMKIARRRHLCVIEDAAEAHGSVYQGKKIGTWGDMAAFSLYVAHIISTGEGGVVVTDNAEFSQILRSLRSHGRACKCDVCVLNTKSGKCRRRFAAGTDIRFVFERIGFSAKMNEMEAALGLGNLDAHEIILEKRRRNFRYLREKFRAFEKHLSTIDEGPGEVIGPHAFPILVRAKAPFTRDELVRYFEAREIDTRNLFASMPTQCAGFKFLKQRIGQFPEAEFMGNNGLHIGVHQDLGRIHLDFVLNTLSDFLNKHA